LERTNAKVIATARSPEESDCLQELTQRFGEDRLITPYLDVCVDSSFDSLVEQLPQWGVDSIDILIGNAGIATSEHPHENILDANLDEMFSVFNTNVVGNMRLLRTFTPFLQKSHLKLAVIMSSHMGSISDVPDRGEAVVYRISKAALNMMSVLYAIDPAVKENGVKVLIVHPGWVKTDMGLAGGQPAKIDVNESTNAMIDMIEKVCVSQLRHFKDQEKSGSEGMGKAKEGGGSDEDVVGSYRFSTNVSDIEKRSNYNEVVSHLDSDNFVFASYDGRILQW
jgi:NAD(P)-dependent dehydrogenase (short-subunit alcohol dehydrogenase family)